MLNFYVCLQLAECLGKLSSQVRQEDFSANLRNLPSSPLDFSVVALEGRPTLSVSWIMLDEMQVVQVVLTFRSTGIFQARREELSAPVLERLVSNNKLDLHLDPLVLPVAFSEVLPLEVSHQNQPPHALYN
jgi:hypothetical protein